MTLSQIRQRAHQAQGHVHRSASASILHFPGLVAHLDGLRRLCPPRLSLRIRRPLTHRLSFPLTDWFSVRYPNRPRHRFEKGRQGQGHAQHGYGVRQLRRRRERPDGPGLLSLPSETSRRPRFVFFETGPSIALWSRSTAERRQGSVRPFPFPLTPVLTTPSAHEPQRVHDLARPPVLHGTDPVRAGPRTQVRSDARERSRHASKNEEEPDHGGLHRQRRRRAPSAARRLAPVLGDDRAQYIGGPSETQRWSPETL